MLSIKLFLMAKEGRDFFNFLQFAGHKSMAQWKRFSWRLGRYHMYVQVLEFVTFVLEKCIKSAWMLSLKFYTNPEGVRRRKFCYICIFIVGKFFQDQMTRVFVSHIFNDNKGFLWNSKKYSVENDYKWNTAVY